MKLPRIPRLRLPKLRKTHKPPKPVRAPAVILGRSRKTALVVIAVLVGAASLVSFAESYRALLDWSSRHDLYGGWAWIWPLQVDSFIAVGELALFVALVDAWQRRSRVGAWLVTLAGLTVSVAGNVGHVSSHMFWDRATAAVPPIAAAAALAVGLGVLKRVVEHHHEQATTAEPETVLRKVPSSVLDAAKASMRATYAAGNPLSANALAERFSLTRAQATEVRDEVLALNGSGPHE